MPPKLGRASNAIGVRLHGECRRESWLVSDAAVLSTMSATHQQHCSGCRADVLLATAMLELCSLDPKFSAAAIPSHADVTRVLGLSTLPVDAVAHTPPRGGRSLGTSPGVAGEQG